MEILAGLNGLVLGGLGISGIWLRRHRRKPRKLAAQRKP